MPRYTDESKDRVREAIDMHALVSERTDLRRAHPGWPERQLHGAMLAHASPPARHLRTLLGVRPAG